MYNLSKALVFEDEDGVIPLALSPFLFLVRTLQRKDSCCEKWAANVQIQANKNPQGVARKRWEICSRLTWFWQMSLADVNVRWFNGTCGARIN